MPQKAVASGVSTDLLRTLKNSLRSSCAIVGNSSGLLQLTGADRLDLLHRLGTNDLVGMKSGQVRPTVFVTEKGRIVDLALVIVREEDVLLACSARAHERLRSWIEKYIIMDDVQVADLSSSHYRVTVPGPDAVQAMTSLAGSVIAPDTFVDRPSSGGTNLAMVTRAATGMQGTVVVDREQAGAVAERLTGMMPVLEGVEAEGARIAFGIPAAGHELSEAFNPYDAGLRHAISFTKGCYIGQEVIARLDTYQKIRRRLLGVLVREPAGNLGASPVPLEGTGQSGVMTSLVNLGRGGIGLAVVSTEFSSPDSLMMRRQPGAPVAVHLCPLPFTVSDLDQLEHA
jgi:tRNA-modifying protein YgfZ